MINPAGWRIRRLNYRFSRTGEILSPRLLCLVPALRIGQRGQFHNLDHLGIMFGVAYEKQIGFDNLLFNMFQILFTHGPADRPLDIHGNFSFRGEYIITRL